MQNILSVNPGENRRIVAISDIHGAKEEFSLLLQKAALAPEDILVLNGDYINRGRESADVVAMVMALSQRPNTYILKGNIERLVDWYLRWGEPAEILHHFNDHVNNLFCDWAEQLGFFRPNEKTFAAVRAAVAAHFAEEAVFLRDLPLGLDMGGLIFAHGGIAPLENWRESGEQALLKNDTFLSEGENKTGSWVIVGHMPVWNAAFSRNTNNASVDFSRKIIGIDGGNQVKTFSQLNALEIIKKGENFAFSTIFVDTSPVVFAVCDYSPAENQGFFKEAWPDFYLDVLEKGSEFSLCRRKASGFCGLVKNEHIGSWKGQTCFAKSSVSALLSVYKGEELFLLDEECGGFSFVKTQSGRLGFVPRRCVAGQGK